MYNRWQVTYIYTAWGRPCDSAFFLCSVRFHIVSFLSSFSILGIFFMKVCVLFVFLFCFLRVKLQIYPQTFFLSVWMCSFLYLYFCILWDFFYEYLFCFSSYYFLFGGGVVASNSSSYIFLKRCMLVYCLFLLFVYITSDFFTRVAVVYVFLSFFIFWG